MKWHRAYGIGLAVLLFALFILTGCATQSSIQAYGGSRADGIVTVGYPYGSDYNTDSITESDGEILATARCLAWGFTGARRFGGAKRDCQLFQRNMFGAKCVSGDILIDYQCLGDPDIVEKGEQDSVDIDIRNNN